MTVGLTHFLVVSSLLFGLGLFAVVTRKNAIMILMGIELILNSANINFIAFAKYGRLGLDGQIICSGYYIEHLPQLQNR
jgi:NADH-quinone oxidoreductase subunit K